MVDSGQSGGSEADLDALVVPSSLKLAGAILMLAGAFTGVTGLQVLLFFNMRGALNLVGPVALALGVANVVLGFGVVRGRGGAARAGVATGGLTLLLAVAWIGFALMNGVVSLTALSVLPLSGVATLLVATSLEQARAIDRARERLRAQGLDAGF